MSNPALVALAAKHNLSTEAMADIEAHIADQLAANPRARSSVIHALGTETIALPNDTIGFMTTQDVDTVALPQMIDRDEARSIAESVRHTYTSQHHSPRHDTERYLWRHKLGQGGMGEVWQVFDRDLGRTIALKAVLPQVMQQPRALARVIEEAQVCAQLEHPNIIPVHEMGRLADGRFYFTMQEIRGRSFDHVISAVHKVRRAGGYATEDGWTLRRLLDAFHSVCQAVGHAHSHGVVHRDLKPANVMIGNQGQVQVVDWGLAKVRGLPDRSAAELRVVQTSRTEHDAQMTNAGEVTGTPAYMPPEQANGEVDRIDTRSDVYSLGAILYQVLTDRPPFEGHSARDVLRQVQSSGPRRIAPSPMIPDELISLVERAMSRTMDERFPDGNALATDINAWLDGAKKRERAMHDVAASTASDDLAKRQRNLAQGLRAEATALLQGIAPWESEEQKAAGWSKEDEADAMERTAALSELRAEQHLHRALSHAADLPEAHAALAQRYRRVHQQMENVRDEWNAARMEILLESHAQRLSSDHPDRISHAAYLKGTGAVSLITDPPGAEVFAERYELKRRRLVPVPIGSLGRTPLHEAPLPMGSYRLRLRAAGRRETLYPVSIGRGEHWHGIAPGEAAPFPIRLPLEDELDVDDCYIPAGWFWSGGDRNATDASPRRRVWTDPFVIRRFPVTNRTYIDFLDDLVLTGRGEEALCHVPRERPGHAGEFGAMVYGRDDNGRFKLVVDADGDQWLPDYPVCSVSWWGAMAYAKWLREETGLGWRLPRELEWEKAARGVDGRFFPWGDTLDPSWACMRESHNGQMLPQVVDSFPIDLSPFGVRGAGGNMRDWCADLYAKESPTITNNRLPPVAHGTKPEQGRRAVRGGAWFSSSQDSRLTHRSRLEPSSVSPFLSFRLCRSAFS